MSISAVHLSVAAGRSSGVAALPVETSPHAAARSVLHITKRGRIVLVAVIAGPLVLLALWFGLNSGMAGAASDSSAAPAAIEHVTVHQGESLWQVAETIAPHQDPRAVVSAIVDFNGLQSSVLMPGQSLAIPPQFAGGGQ